MFLKNLLPKYKTLFEVLTDLPSSHGVEHKIVEEPHTVPQCKNPYRMGPSELRELQTQIEMLLQRNFIRPSSSPYGAPVLFAPKKDGKLRLCLDYRALNAQTVKDTYPCPRDRDVLDQLSGAKYFSNLDAREGYWQIRMEKESIPKTSIRTPLGSF